MKILQTEDATSNTYETLKEFDSTSRQIQPATVHYASYEKSKKSTSRIHILMLLLVLNVSGVVNPSAKSISRSAKLRMFTVMSVVNMDIFRLYAKVWDNSPSELKGSRIPILPIENRLIMFSDAPVQNATGFYNEQGNWVAEPPRPSPIIQTAHLVSVKQKVAVIQNIQDIHPEIDPETSLTQGMTKSQIFPSEKQ